MPKLLVTFLSCPSLCCLRHLLRAVHSFSESHNNAFISIFCEGLQAKFCFENSRREITFWWDGAHDTILPVSNQFIFLSSLPLQIKCLNITIKSVVFAHPTKKTLLQISPLQLLNISNFVKKNLFQPDAMSRPRNNRRQVDWVV